MKVEIKDSIGTISDVGNIDENNYWEIVRQEVEIRDKVKFLNVKIVDSDIESLRFLAENGYFVKSRDPVTHMYILEKECYKNSSWRISLTEKCNYRCFFCHEEGLDMGKERKEEKSRDEVYNLIKLGVKSGYVDITFTGGEPLLKRQDIIWYLKKLNEEKIYPDITIVTNGLLIDDELLDAVTKYNGKIKFNFSLHSLDCEKYLKIVLPEIKPNKENFNNVLENIKKITKRRISAKLNYVLLNGINTSKEDIAQILNFAYENGVECVKFLELLVVEKLAKKGHYKYYYQLESLYKEWQDEFKMFKKLLRRDVYLYRDKVQIELQKCCCSVGCTKCILDKDISLTAELKYYPCFLRTNQNYNVNSENLKEVLETGNNLIKNFAKKYGNSSPLLVKKKSFIKWKKEYYYTVEVDMSFDKIIDILKDGGYKEYERRNFEEIYYVIKKHGDKERYIHKLFKNSHTNYYVEVVQKITKDDDNGFIIEFWNNKFDKEPKQILNNELSDYETYLLIFNLKRQRILKWETITLEKNGNKISIGIIEENKRIILMSTKIYDDIIFKEKLKTVLLQDFVVDN